MSGSAPATPPSLAELVALYDAWRAGRGTRLAFEVALNRRAVFGNDPLEDIVALVRLLDLDLQALGLPGGGDGEP